MRYLKNDVNPCGLNLGSKIKESGKRLPSTPWLALWIVFPTFKLCDKIYFPIPGSLIEGVDTMLSALSDFGGSVCVVVIFVLGSALLNQSYL